MFWYYSAVKGNQSLASPQVKIDVLRVTAQTQVPSGQWETGRYWFLLPSTFSFPSSIPLTSRLFHSGPLEIPLPSCPLKGILHWHSAAISVRLVIQLRINTKCISIFQALAKWPAVSLGKETLWQEKCFPLDGPGHVSVALQAVFQCLSSQTEQDRVFLSWQSRHGLISMFSNQTTSMFSQGEAVLFQGPWTINCNVAGKWRVQQATANYTLTFTAK